MEVERVNPPYCKCTFLRGMKDSLFIWSIIERRILTITSNTDVVPLFFYTFNAFPNVMISL